MMNPPTIHYNPRGYEATYDPASDTCSVVVRGYQAADGKLVERGGPSHPTDRVLARFTIANIGATGFSRSNVRDTFIDALDDNRDLLGATMFRHKPVDSAERRLFAAAFDAAQRIRAKATLLGTDKLIFSLSPSLFSIVDCFARDAKSFWLMSCASPDGRTLFDQSLPLAAYILERGGYVPSTASVRLGVWNLSQTGAKFSEVPNDRAAARDIVIDHLLKTPF